MPAQSVAKFQSKGGGSGEEASFPLVGDDIQLRVIISDLRGCADCAGGNSTTVLIQLDC